MLRDIIFLTIVESHRWLVERALRIEVIIVTLVVFKADLTLMVAMTMLVFNYLGIVPLFVVENIFQSYELFFVNKNHILHLYNSIRDAELGPIPILLEHFLKIDNFVVFDVRMRAK